jgi:hypothetical protein
MTIQNENKPILLSEKQGKIRINKPCYLRLQAF